MGIGLFSTNVHAQRARIAPEAASNRATKSAATAKTYMVAAANPLAVKAGFDWGCST